MQLFTGEILRLHNQGFTAGYIANRLGVATGYVRVVVSSQLAGCEAKPLYTETATPPKRSKEARHRAARRIAAEAKRAEALRLLAEAEAEAQ